MKKILIAFCALFFLSTLTHASELKEKFKTEKQSVIVEKSVIFNADKVESFDADKIEQVSYFVLDEYDELVKSEKTTIKESFKPDKLTADFYNCNLNECSLNVMRENYHKIL